MIILSTASVHKFNFVLEIKFFAPYKIKAKLEKLFHNTFFLLLKPIDWVKGLSIEGVCKAIY
jgi:hypothetical protein